MGGRVELRRVVRQVSSGAVIQRRGRGGRCYGVRQCRVVASRPTQELGAQATGHAARLGDWSQRGAAYRPQAWVLATKRRIKAE